MELSVQRLCRLYSRPAQFMWWLVGQASVLFHFLLLVFGDSEAVGGDDFYHYYGDGAAFPGLPFGMTLVLWEK